MASAASTASGRRAALGDIYASASPFALAGVVAGGAVLAHRHYRALPAVTVSASGAAALDRWPRVSIIVPARDEAHNLPSLLDSLLALDYPDYEVIVVDDASRDATGALADAYAARSGGLVRAIHSSGPLPPGWTGKSYACWTGARAATGEWLLFTDADTTHAPGSLRTAGGAALAANAQALSLFTAQRCVTFWERLLLPFAYQQYFAGVQPKALARPDGPALANGQYFLISRKAYAASGGHRAVAASIIDDVALAGALKRSGFLPRVCRGETLVCVRMYASLPALAQGFTKNTAQFLSEQKAAAVLVVAGTAATAAIAPALITAVLRRRPIAVAGALLAYTAQAAGLLPWLRGFGVPRRYALLGPLAALTFTAIALSSAWHTLARRSVRWKGRDYSTASP